jgi:hypothetical protein
VNQNNFLRNIKNFKIDLRLTDPKAYICGIHWQVAQGTSLENIEFYMRYNSDTPGNTQQVCRVREFGLHEHFADTSSGHLHGKWYVTLEDCLDMLLTILKVLEDFSPT